LILRAKLHLITPQIIQKLTDERAMVRNESCLLSGLRREVVETCALLGYYAARSVNFLPTFRDNLSVPSQGSRINIPEVLTHEDGIHRMFRSQ